ncbi:hypothetical protein IHE45_05G072200 [Dioscorea alata]|uniref:Uncharacterized protein n=1 Tax=Dioscorea alata TaxID=55571 RepID=A0ACB7W270_DIOAL|nr:hypothetical protein IHE45_05G072200 [Dioscorea alata]
MNSMKKKWILSYLVMQAMMMHLINMKTWGKEMIISIDYKSTTSTMICEFCLRMNFLVNFSYSICCVDFI